MVIEVDDCEIQIDTEDLDLLSIAPWHVDLFNGKKYLHCHKGFFHRLVMGLPNSNVDHRDGDTLNNQKSNLRKATQSQNMANSKHQVGCSSIYKGVTKNAGKYDAYITVNYKKIHLSRNKSEVISAAHYDMAALMFFGEFASLNFPNRRNEYLLVMRDSMEETDEHS